MQFKYFVLSLVVAKFGPKIVAMLHKNIAVDTSVYGIMTGEV